MSHNASDAQKLLSVDTVTATSPSNNPFAVTKGLTSSNPSGGGKRYFMLPDPATVPQGMSFEIKDSAGTAAGGTTKIIVQAPATIMIDGSTDDDEITKNWGSKTYVSTGTGYVVRGDQRAVGAVASGGGALLVDFGGLDGDPLPTGWSSTTSGTGIDWLISTDTFHADGSNVSTAGSDHDPDSTALGAASTSSPALSTLFYNAGTVVTGKIVKFRWLRDGYDYHSLPNWPGNTTGYYNKLRFYVNGVYVASHSSRLNWQTYSYTVPSTGTYIFSWEWYRISAVQDSGLMNGCFVDEFEILEAPSPTEAYNFDGVEEAPLPTGWSAARTGAWPADSSGWLHQEGIFYPASTSTSSLGDHFDGTGHLLPLGESSTLTYNAGTLTAGQVIEFQWMRSLYNMNRHSLHFEVNGSSVSSTSGGSRGVWYPITYTIPTTGTYTLSWRWQVYTHSGASSTSPSYLNGCFIDEFKILPPP